MKFQELIKKNRSYRRFKEDFYIDIHILKKLIDIARYSPSAANLQPIKYILSNEQKKNELIFPNLSWAGYLKDWDGPSVGERPSAYIIILGDTEISKAINWDHGITAHSILLGAAENELGGCIIGSINRDKLRISLGINPRYEILLVVALGKPDETIVINDIEKYDDIKYWRDDNNVHHVPKRSLNDIILDI